MPSAPRQNSAPPPSPFTAAALALLGLALVLRNAEAVFISVLQGHFNFAPIVLVAIGVGLCGYALKTWRAGLAAASKKPIPPAAFRPAARPLASAAPRAPARAASAPKEGTLIHPYVELSLPAGWKNGEAPDGLFALFEGPNHEIVNVVIAELATPRDVEASLDRVMSVHKDSIAQNYAECDARPAEILTGHPAYLEARRVFNVRAEGPPWRIFARYAITTAAMLMRDGRSVHAFVQIVYYGTAWQADSAVDRAILDAVLVPQLSALIAASEPPAKAKESWK